MVKARGATRHRSFRQTRPPLHIHSSSADQLQKCIEQSIVRVNPLFLCHHGKRCWYASVPFHLLHLNQIHKFITYEKLKYTVLQLKSMQRKFEWQTGNNGLPWLMWSTVAWNLNTLPTEENDALKCRSFKHWTWWPVISSTCTATWHLPLCSRRAFSNDLSCTISFRSFWSPSFKVFSSSNSRIESRMRKPYATWMRKVHSETLVIKSE